MFFKFNQVDIDDVEGDSELSKEVCEHCNGENKCNHCPVHTY